MLTLERVPAGLVKLVMAISCAAVGVGAMATAANAAEPRRYELLSGGRRPGPPSQDVESRGPSGRGGPRQFAASDDGTKVFFATRERLVARDTDAAVDVYRRSGGRTFLMSRGDTNGNGAHDVVLSSVSADGRVVLFSTSERLVAADVDDYEDWYTRSNGTTQLVTPGRQPLSDFAYVLMSRDGSRFFFSTAERLVAQDTDNLEDIYETSGGATRLVTEGRRSGSGGGSVGCLSRDGLHVFFLTSDQFVTADTNSDYDIYERFNNTTRLVSVDNAGHPAGAGFECSASVDGSKVFFTTYKSLVAADTNSEEDIYRRANGTTTLISTGPYHDNRSYVGATYLKTWVHRDTITPEGTSVVFDTEERLVPEDTDELSDVYQRTGTTTTLLSRRNGSPATGNAYCPHACEGETMAVANDGLRVFFVTQEPLVPEDDDTGTGRFDNYDFYLRSGGRTTLVAPMDFVDIDIEAFVDISNDGERFFFITGKRLVPEDRDSSPDTYEWRSGEYTLITSGDGSAFSRVVGLSSDGTRVFLVTTAQLAPEDTDDDLDLYGSYVTP